MGGHLVAINTVYEQMFLLSQIAEATHSTDSEKFWIGLGAYINPDSDALDYKWSTSEPVTFTAWAENQPSKIAALDERSTRLISIGFQILSTLARSHFCTTASNIITVSKKVDLTS